MLVRMGNLRSSLYTNNSFAAFARCLAVYPLELVQPKRASQKLKCFASTAARDVWGAQGSLFKP